jgi:hypothetical protein
LLLANNLLKDELYVGFHGGEDVDFVLVVRDYAWFVGGYELFNGTYTLHRQGDVGHRYTRTFFYFSLSLISLKEYFVATVTIFPVVRSNPLQSEHSCLRELK